MSSFPPGYLTMIQSLMLRVMQVKGIVWVGSVTDDRDATTRFFSEVLGMPVETNVPGFSRLVAANGDRLELFGPDSVEHDRLDTGPVAGLWVDDAKRLVTKWSRQEWTL